MSSSTGPENTKANESENQEQPHWRLLRDVLAFQFKLALDALRDLALSPVSIVAAIAGLVNPEKDPERYFRRLMQFGRRTDHWINLFDSNDHETQVSSDLVVKKVEDIVRGKYQQGGIVRDIKEGTDDLLEKLGDKPQSKNQED